MALKDLETGQGRNGTRGPRGLEMWGILLRALDTPSYPTLGPEVGEGERELAPDWSKDTIQQEGKLGFGNARRGTESWGSG